MPQDDARLKFPIGSYCSSPSWGGLEMNVVRFLRWLGERGWPVHLYAHPDHVMFRRAQEHGIAVRPIKARSRRGALGAMWALSRRAREDGLRILTVHQSTDLPVAVVSRRLAARSFELIFSQHMHLADKRDLLHTWQFNQLAAWATPVRWLADRVLEKTRIDPAKVHVVPRGIEISRFTIGRPSRQAARRKMHLPEDAWVAGVIGRLDPKKGQDVAIRAVHRVHEAGIPMHLLVVAGTSFVDRTNYAGYVRGLVQQLGLQEYVHFREHQPRPEYAYAALDCFLMASQSETYGMVTIEAMACATPVIGTADGGTLSLIDHERNGLLVTPMDPDQMAEALVRLIENPQLAATLAEEAEREAKIRFSHHTQCEHWERLLQSVVNGSGVARASGESGERQGSLNSSDQ